MSSACTLAASVCYYQDLRSTFITTGLTMGTFMFTMKAFVIQTMKRDLYDVQEYQDAVAQRRKEGKKDSFYGQLDALRRLMFWAIVFAFLSAAVNVLLGGENSVLCAVIGFAVTGVSWLLVLISLLMVSHNLKEMLRISEQIAVAKKRN